MQLLDTAEIKDIKSLISNGNELSLHVNFYQRPYRWTAKKITDLFEDYKDNRTLASTGNSSFEYFVGAAVFVDERTDAEKQSGKIWKYQVVDGQQRFTTMFLFNYIKYLLLIKKADEAAQKNKSSDFNDALKEMINCYKGFIGSNNISIIEQANKDLTNAFDNANQNRTDIDINDLNIWRKRVGWIENPDISEDDYFDKCCNAMGIFLSNEKLRIIYENTTFNTFLKEALSKIVISFSNASDASFCMKPINDYQYDENDDTKIEFPYVIRAYGIFEHIKEFCKEINSTLKTPYDKLCGYINLIDEMLENIKLCLIVTSDEDDAYKLFETLNDRSESVNDLELLKNYFYKTYTMTSGEDINVIYTNISSLDERWRNIFFKCQELEPEIFEYMTVFFTGNTNKNTNERKRKLIKQYLESYNITSNNYTYDKIDRDFCYMEYIQEILLRIHKLSPGTNRIDKNDSQLSLYIENDPSSSIVKRALALVINLPYSVVVGSFICDLIHNYISNGQSSSSFNSYLDCIFNEANCKSLYPGLWKDGAVMWKATIYSKNYETAKKISDNLALKCNIKEINNVRNNTIQLIQFDPNIIDENDAINEFKEWITEWRFKDGPGKIKIKNLFMHLFLRYDLDKTTDNLILKNSIGLVYKDEAIKQDLDHMDACSVDRKNGPLIEARYFHYNLSDRTDYTNALGNMIPLPVAINRGKHNTPMEETISSFSSEKLTGWIFDMVEDEFNANKILVNTHYVPTEQFFINRKQRLIDYFIRIIKNIKFNPNNSI